MMLRKKQYRAFLNSYLANKISLPVFYERANELGVNGAEAEGDIAVVQIVREQFESNPEKVSESLIDHVLTIVERHVEACRSNGIEPEKKYLKSERMLTKFAKRFWR